MNIRTEVAKIIESSHPSCGLLKECNTECGLCGADRVLDYLKSKGWKSREDVQQQIEQARREGREEIIELVNNMIGSQLLGCREWQALKEAKCTS